ncbi:MAG: 3-deoxy-D-manno-octulosonic acid transferase [Candidatus Omnitrophica bacterium]|nr:3-deoxy-D-manno-octulosonic acid transferase [Candidatus Omnitrophota bacterium]
MIILYDIICLVFALVYLPVYFFKGKFHRGFLRRLGFMPGDLIPEKPIWIHAVSVGEAASVKQLVLGLRKAYPHKKIVISTVTATGNKIARGLVREGDLLTYLPLDFSFIVARVMRMVDPCLFVIAETEIWPNLITFLYKRKVPVITVNGRISDRSYSGYRAIRLLLRPVLKKISKFCVQSNTDADRLMALGVAEEKVVVTGNVKFDIDLESAGGEPDKSRAVRDNMWMGPTDKLLVCGSTHPGEEAIIMQAYKELLQALPGLKLLLAPRHPERSREVAGVVEKYSFMPVFVSGLSGSCPTCINRPVFILDLMGELLDYYSAADVVFVGGSLVKTGGHNILEPASRKKPVLFGPYMSNFRDIAGLFLEKEAGIMVPDCRALAGKVKEILSDALRARRMGERAYGLIADNKGATGRNIEIIRQFMPV